MKLLFYDHGNNLGLAELAARAGHSVSYYMPPTEHYWRSIAGTNIRGITKVDHFNPLDSDEAIALGHPAFYDDDIASTFGASQSFTALERDRAFARERLLAAGLPVQGYRIIRGVGPLLTALAKETHKVVKVSRFRDIETFTHTDWLTTLEQFVPKILNAYGMDGEIEFILEDRIESKVEVGSDDILHNGRPNGLRPYGYEAKDSAYIARLDSEKDVVGITDRLALHNNYGAPSTFFSVEKRGQFPIDITVRTPWPPTAALAFGYKNLIDVIITGNRLQRWNTYAGCLVLSSGWVCEHPVKVEVPNETRAAVMLTNYFSRDGEDRWVAPTMSSQDDTIGYVSACADSLELLRNLLVNAAVKIKAKDLRYDLAALDDLIDKIIPMGRVAGIPF